MFLACEQKEIVDIAVVKTGSSKDIKARSALLEAQVVNIGAGIEEHGHCWSKEQNPSINDEKSSLGGIANEQVYLSKISDLEPGTTYNYRAYVLSNGVPIYGINMDFQTLDGFASVNTLSISNITEHTAESGGNVTDAGGDKVIGRGICWDKDSLFSLDKCVGYTKEGIGTGSFTSDIKDLEAATKYFAKAYSITTVDTTYGQVKSFSTKTGMSVLTTKEVSEITAISAKSGGEISDAGAAEVTARGVCWNTIGEPTIEDSKTEDGSDTGSFASTITRLQAKTTYFVRSYAISSYGTGYGNEITFSTSNGIAALTTSDVTDITAISATSGGEITEDGGAPITVRGVCWNTTGEPTVNDTKTEDDSGTGNFTSSLSGLNANTMYYVRSYSINVIDTTYGNEITFTTLDGLSTLTTVVVTDITINSAISGGEITEDGGAPITVRGVCWNTTGEPTVNDTKTEDGSDTGSFTSGLTGLSAGVTYYVRSYATNSITTAYGDELMFTTKDGIATITTYPYGAGRIVIYPNLENL